MIEATATTQTSSAQGSSKPAPPRSGKSPNPLPSGGAPAPTDRPAVTSWNISVALSNLAIAYDRTDLTFREMDELKVAMEKRAGLNVRLCDFCSRAHAVLITETFMRICGQCKSEGRDA